MNQNVISEKVIAYAKILHQKNFLAAADGNMSARISENEILITPSGCSKAFIKSEDMALVTLDGKTLKGNPSSELKMHLKVYQNCEKAKAVIHAHPPMAVAWTVARPELKELPLNSLSEVILACGSIPIVPFAFPGSEEMGNHLEPFLPERRAMILARHGALTWGESVEEAHRGMERIEHAACILSYAIQLGGLSELSPREIETLQTMRKKIGEKTF